LLGVPAGQHFK